MTKYEVTMPEIYNLICPRCKKAWLNKIENEPTYFCYCCTYIIFEKEVKELFNKEGLR